MAEVSLSSVIVATAQEGIHAFSFIFFFQKRGVLERLDAGEVVVGDGGFLFCLEKRGYVKAGQWTPEATVEHPEAGLWTSTLCRIDEQFPRLVLVLSRVNDEDNVRRNVFTALFA